MKTFYALSIKIKTNENVQRARHQVLKNVAADETWTVNALHNDVKTIFYLL